MGEIGDFSKAFNHTTEELKVITISYDKLAEEVAERKQAEEEFQQSVKNANRTLEETVDALASAIEIRDSYTAGHQRQVTHLACAIAEEIGLSYDHIEGIRLAGLIHDIGKISIPAEILSKPSRLSEPETSLIKNHPEVGYEILRHVDFPWPIARIILQHHEKMDASGYPNKLMGEDILLEARVLCVSDVVEAMSSHHPYRPSPGVDKALEEISQNRGILYDPDVVDACLRLFTEKRFECVQAKFMKSPFRIRDHSSPDVSSEKNQLSNKKEDRLPLLQRQYPDYFTRLGISQIE